MVYNTRTVIAIHQLAKSKISYCSSIGEGIKWAITKDCNGK